MVRQALADHWLDAVVIVAITFLLVPAGPTAPQRGLDTSWLAGLHVFPADGARFGPELVFTYGPLGFLSVPLEFTPGAWLWSTLVFTLALGATTTTAYLLLRRTCPRWISALVLATGLPLLLLGVDHMGWYGTPLPVLLAGLATMWATTIAAASRRTSLSVVGALGAFVGFACLVKVDAGVLCVTALALAILMNGIRVGDGLWLARGAAVFAGTAALVAAALWLVTGQRLADLDDWLRGSIEIVTGYASSMGVDDPDLWFEYVAALALAVIVGAGLVTSRSSSREQRLAVAVVLAPVIVIAFRQGFVRHTQPAFVFFTLMGFVAIALVPTVRLPWAVGLGAISLALVVTAGSFDVTRVDPTTRAETATAVWRTLSDDSARDERTERNRDTVRAQYGFSDAFLASIGDGTVVIQPFDLMAAYAYTELDWRSLPVFQDYSAYTAALDEANADALAASTAPDFVIRQPGLAIDGRWSRWEPPRATLELACRYREVGRDHEWVLLQRGEDRCGEPQPVSTVSAELGETVPVPDGDGPDGEDIVVARFHGVGDAFVDRARTASFRGPEYHVDVGDGVRRRFVPDTQGSWHVVRAPECVTRFVDGTATSPDSLRFSTDAWAPSGRRPVIVEFAVVPFRC
jgi:hypothetical protein